MMNHFLIFSLLLIAAASFGGDAFILPPSRVRSEFRLQAETETGALEEAEDFRETSLESSEVSLPSFGSPEYFPHHLMTRRESGLVGTAILAAPMLMGQQMNGILGGSVPPMSAEAVAALETGDALVRNLWLGRLAYPTLIVALEMGFFEVLKDKTLTLEQLGRKLNPPLQKDSRALQGVTSVVASLGLAHIKSDSIRLSEAAQLVLLEESPYFWGSQLLNADGITASLRRRVHLESRNAEHHAAYDSHSNQAIESFIDSMQSHSAATAEATALALSGMIDVQSTHLLDMAGGSGCFSCALKRRLPGLKVTLADLPSVVAYWRRKSGLSMGNNNNNSIQAVPADLFEASTWPKDCNVILLANVLHDWGEEQVESILSNARQALLQQDSSKTASGRRVIVVEQLLRQDRSGPLPASLASISMLLGDWRTGKQYSLNELETLAKKAGFSRVELGPKCGSFHHAVICHV
jgi:hypothetical protein